MRQDFQQGTKPGNIACRSKGRAASAEPGPKQLMRTTASWYSPPPPDWAFSALLTQTGLISSALSFLFFFGRKSLKSYHNIWRKKKKSLWKAVKSSLLNQREKQVIIRGPSFPFLQSHWFLFLYVMHDFLSFLLQAFILWKDKNL